jgi:hypothetical protein
MQLGLFRFWKKERGLDAGEASLFLLIISTAVAVFSRTVADPDLWGHVKFGEDLWLTGQITRQDPYSYLTANQLWVNHEWLAEAIFYLAYATAGPLGLVALKTTISLIIVVFLCSHLRCQGLTPVRVGTLLMLGAIILLPYLALVRPQVFTFLFFLLVLLIIYKSEQGDYRLLWAMPFIFAVWVNLHGGFLAGIGIVLLWSAIHLSSILISKPSLRVLFNASNLPYFFAPLSAMLGTLLNPYGPELLRFLLRTATGPRRDIVEWQPLVLMSPEGMIYLPLLVISLIGVLYSRRERKPAVVFMFLVLCFMPHLASRHLPLFALGALVLTAEHIADVWEHYAPGRGSSSTRLPFERWMGGLNCFMAIFLLAVSAQNFRCIRLSPATADFPARAIALLKDSGVSGNLVIHFGWGEYALWHLGPRIKVSIDGRRETVYPEKIYNQSWVFMLGLGDWDAILREGPADMALVGKKFQAFNLMSLKRDWRLVYEDPFAALFVPNGSPVVEKIRSTNARDIPANGAGLCFP